MLTKIQYNIIRTIVENRHEHSFFTGGSIINRNLPRLSADLDIFNDGAEICIQSFHHDVQSLQTAGFQTEITQTPTLNSAFGAASVSDGQEFSRIDWAYDSPFRFFPALQNPDYGFRLHDYDLVINKILACAGRREVRDYYDLCTLTTAGAPIIPFLWAACAKDPGYTPYLVLDRLSFNSRYSQDEYDALQATEEIISPIECKKIFLSLINEAQNAFATLPLHEAGTLYLDKSNNLQAFIPTPKDFKDGRVSKNPGGLYGSLQNKSSAQSSKVSYSLKPSF